MSALSITAANVQPASNAVILSGTFGATITAGQVVYELSSDNEWYLADADVLATSVVAGIAINGGSDGQAGDIQIVGDIDLGATHLAMGVRRLRERWRSRAGRSAAHASP